ncbi:MAG: hypothetical protein IJD87_05020 [Turicibacter sp.]|nr:hypothetical protein [Turicibacter sp.]
MKCLVCHQPIVINRFQELLALESPLLCVPCQTQLIPKKGETLFEENEWLKSVIERLNKGDIILTELFINSFYFEIKRRLKYQQQICILNYGSNIPYPWMVILLDRVKQKLTSLERERIQLVFIEEVNSDSQCIKIM